MRCLYGSIFCGSVAVYSEREDELAPPDSSNRICVLLAAEYSYRYEIVIFEHTACS